MARSNRAGRLAARWLSPVASRCHRPTWHWSRPHPTAWPRDRRPACPHRPVPDGYFHVGTGRTALFNWLYARQQGGTFVLRIEDTDTARNRPEHIEGILRALQWLGLDWDEGPYFQSQRGPLYAEAIERLLASGAAYACDCTPEAVAERARRRGDKSSELRRLLPGPGPGARCRAPGAVPDPRRRARPRFDDVIRGTVTVDNADDRGLRGAQVQRRPPLHPGQRRRRRRHGRSPTSSAARTTSPTPPSTCCCGRPSATARCPSSPTCRCCSTTPARSSPSAATRSPSRTTGTRATCPRPCATTWPCSGWSPGDNREILTLDEMVAEFRLEDVKSAGAIFDERKLQAVNAEYLRALARRRAGRAGPGLAARPLGAAGSAGAGAGPHAGRGLRPDRLPVPPALVIDPERMGHAPSASIRPSPPCWPPPPSATRRSRTGPPPPSTTPPWPPARTPACASRGEAQAPIRLAVMGRSVGLPLWESLEVLGRDRTLARLADARARMGAPG